MELEGFLSHADAERARRTLARLFRDDFSGLVLTGGFAVELHLLRRGFDPQQRSLNDIDFLAGSFEEIPEGLSERMLFRHVHPKDPPGTTLLQCADPETAIRVDVFCACGDTMARALPTQIDGIDLRLISIEDLIARTTRLCMDLAYDVPIPGKHARDFLRLLPLSAPDAVETVWQEHRKPNHPESFKAAVDIVTDLIHTRPGLQIIPGFSQDTNALCHRCEVNASFPLADPERILSLLGYC